MTDEIGIHPETVLVRNAEIVVRRSKAEIVALCPSKGLFFSLNETSIFILESLNGRDTLEEVVGGVVDSFDVAEDVAVEAVLSVCQRFIEHDFAHRAQAR